MHINNLAKISETEKKPERNIASVLVVSTANPEVDYLALALARSEHLFRYVRRYANKNRLWERAVSRVPGFGNRYKHTLGRRYLPNGLSSNLVTTAGVVEDFSAAIISRMGMFSSETRTRWVNKLMTQRDISLAQAGHRLASYVQAVIANYTVGLPAFRMVKARGGKAILNYPIAHHRYAQRLLQDEARREPEFAATLSGHEHSHELTAQLNAECELADRILVGSTFARDTFVEEGIPAEKLIIVPYGARMTLFTPSEKGQHAKSFRVLFVGQIGQRKGVPYLLRAFKAFRGSGAELTLVGDFVNTALPFAPYRDIFTHISHVPQVMLREIYHRSDVFVFPTLLEGMPMVVVEAMAAGLPVIVTPNGPGDIVRDGIDGFVVPIRDEHAIIDRLEYLRSHPAECKEMGKRARERALQYTWDAYCATALARVLEVFDHDK